MRYTGIFTVIIAFFSLSNCIKEAELQPKDYPLVTTNIPIVSSEGAIFSAEVVNPGNLTIIKYGFVWSENTRPTINDSRIFQTGNANGNYTFVVTADLIKGRHYGVRACLITENYVIYGTEVSFTSMGSLPPLLISFSPKKGYAGERIIINGDNFSSVPENNIVKFGESIAIVDSANSNTLYVRSPLIKENRKVRISVTTSEMTCQSDDYYDVIFSWVRKNDFPGGSSSLGLSFTIQSRGYVIVGIENPLNDPQNVWEYDPDNDHWTKRGQVPFWADNETSTFIIYNRAYIYSRNDDAYFVYDPETNNWSIDTRYPGRGRKTVSFVIEDKAFVGTGTCSSGQLTEFYKYDPSLQQWTKIAEFPGAPRYNATGFSLNGMGYVGLGESYGAVFSDIWEYDPKSNTWSRKNDFPDEGRSMAISFNLNSKIYVGFGTRTAASSSYPELEGNPDIWEYQASSDNWTEKDPYIGRGKLQNLVFEFSNEVYVGTGCKYPMNARVPPNYFRVPIYYFDVWVFNPNLK